LIHYRNNDFINFTFPHSSVSSGPTEFSVTVNTFFRGLMNCPSISSKLGCRTVLEQAAKAAMINMQKQDKNVLDKLDPSFSAPAESEIQPTAANLRIRDKEAVNMPNHFFKRKARVGNNKIVKENTKVAEERIEPAQNARDILVALQCESATKALAIVEQALQELINSAKEQSLKTMGGATYEYTRGRLRGFEQSLQLVEAGRKELHELRSHQVLA
jgi:hypothetical protein